VVVIGRYWRLSPRLSGTVMNGVIKIWRLKDNGVATLIFLGLRDVIGHVTIRLAVVDL